MPHRELLRAIERYGTVVAPAVRKAIATTATRGTPRHTAIRVTSSA